MVPEPISPFSSATRRSVTFRWAMPVDGAPVRVELFDAMRIPLWTSGPSREGALRPPAEDAARWPAGDLLWRPVALPSASPERPGDLAAFTLLP